MNPAPGAGPPLAGRLADNVAYFSRALRAAGLPVGPAAIVGAIEALEVGGVAERDDLYWTLHATLVSRRESAPVFDAVFRRFWRRRGLAGDPAARPPEARRPPDQASAPRPGEARAAAAVQPDAVPRPAEAPDDAAPRRLASSADILRSRDFAQMSAAELAEARHMVARLALPDDRRRTRRLVPDPRGRAIDLRGTLRRSLRAGGAGLDLARRAPATRLPPIVALVDISGSVAAYSRLFLHFLHALGESGRRVHAFVFATRLTNITRELAGRDPDDALARAAGRASDWQGGTRIASALHAFNRLWSRRVLGGGATVLLFSDGLEREVGPDLAFETDRLRRSCRRLVWLNPLLRFEGFEPRAAGIRAMLPLVDAFRPIHSLASMEDLVKALSADMPRRDARRRPLA